MYGKYIGIDYSGAKTPDDGLPGLRVYAATPARPPSEVKPPAGAKRHWTRRGAAAWLQAELAGPAPVLVGIDHSFSFPRAYFAKYALPQDWGGFLDDFCRHWPTELAGVSVDAVREGRQGRGAARSGLATWRRVAEVRARAKSVFHYDVPGSVAKSTHAGLPWLREIRYALGGRVHFWPYDGWLPPEGVSVVAEAYPALCSAEFPRGRRTPDQHDAYSIAAWMRREDAAGRLAGYFTPVMTRTERAAATFEGWIFGL